MSLLFLVRHAHAGDRAAWQGPDEQRPLSDKGWRQARGLVEQLHREEFARIFSSPALRCVQTVQPLADARSLTVEEDDRLLEGHDPEDTQRWLAEEVRMQSVVACTHGDIVPAVVEAAARAGAHMPGGTHWSKGSTWVLEAAGGSWMRARYVPPPG